MSIANTIPNAPFELDLKAVIDAVSAGTQIPADAARRVQAEAERVRQGLRPSDDNFGVQVIRELRGPLDQEHDRDLTLAQRDILHHGNRTLVDPDTGERYLLIAEANFHRLSRQ